MNFAMFVYELLDMYVCVFHWSGCQATNTHTNTSQMEEKLRERTLKCVGFECRLTLEGKLLQSGWVDKGWWCLACGRLAYINGLG